MENLHSKENFKSRLFAATFSGDWLEAAQKYGVGLEINHTCISENLDAEPARRTRLLADIASDMRAAGITAGQPEKLFLHGPFTEIHPAAIDYRARQLGLERLNQAYDVAQAFGISRMVVHNGWLPFIYFKEWQAEKGPEFWQRFLADKPEGFTIYIENVLEDEPYMLADMMRRIDDPRIRLCLDTGHAHAMTAETPVETWIKVLGPYLGHFHLHTNDGTGDDHRTFGEGSLDMEAVFAAIEKYCNDDVTFTIEARETLPCLKWLEEHQYI